MKKILPLILANITRHNREKVDIEWASSSWTFNMFRLWEMIFWRRAGVKAESSVYTDSNGLVVRAFHSWEAVLVHFENFVRSSIKSKVREYVPARIWIPILWTPQGVPVFASPYLFAIGYETSNKAGNGSAGQTSLTVTITNSGSNRLQTMAGYSSTVTSATADGAAMTVVATRDVSGAAHIEMWRKVAPTSGSSINVVANFGSSEGIAWVAACYSGVDQTNPIDSSNSGDSGGGFTTGVSVSTTVVLPNCWLVGIFLNDQNNVVNAGSGTLRQTQSSGYQGVGWIDSNGTVSTGSQSLSSSHVSGRCGGIVASIAPQTAAAVNSTFLMFMLR